MSAGHVLGGWDTDDLYLVYMGPPVVGQVVLLISPENVKESG